MNTTTRNTTELESAVGRQVCLLLTAQTLLLILGSINRLTPLFHGHVAANEFLRWVDFNNLLILPPLGILICIGLRQSLLRLGGARKSWVDLLFILSVYLLGIGYGVHEFANYLSTRVKGDAGIDPVLAEIIRFNDDDFSHWVFFVAFFGQNLALMLWQSFNRFQHRPGLLITFICLLNAAALAGAIYANLSRGKLGFDLVVILLLALISGWLWLRGRQQLLFIYMAAGGWVGLLAAGISRFFFNHLTLAKLF